MKLLLLLRAPDLAPHKDLAGGAAEEYRVTKRVVVSSAAGPLDSWTLFILKIGQDDECLKKDGSVVIVFVCTMCSLMIRGILFRFIQLQWIVESSSAECSCIS